MGGSAVIVRDVRSRLRSATGETFLKVISSVMEMFLASKAGIKIGSAAFDAGHFLLRATHQSGKKSNRRRGGAEVGGEKGSFSQTNLPLLRSPRLRVSRSIIYSLAIQ